ncbi:MAG: serine/threonine-protein kinase [Verrucomicrobiales bacterium]|nr:serine/threonine-protein kinase [Verrucomicrobiales bacterium]
MNKVLTDPAVGNSGAPIVVPFTAPPVKELDEALGEDFTVETLIGQGGMAAVYKGIDHTHDDLPIAIKILPPEVVEANAVEGFDYAKRFEREALAMSKLNHPNLVRVYKLGETADGMHFFTMEYVEGENLHVLIRDGRLTHGHAFSWLIQMCNGLAYAHEEGIVHRDIKPGNVMIDASGYVKITDFGLVKVTGRESMHSMNTVIAMGTPDFSAPEIADGNGRGDHRSDIFSVGMLAYQLFTGYLPKGLWEPPSKRVDGLDHRIDRVIDQALHSEPGERYQDIGQMGRDLHLIAAANDSNFALPPATDRESQRERYFPELEQAEFESLADLAVEMKAAPGDVIIKDGHRNDQLYFLLDGLVNVVKNEATVADLKPGRFVGEMSYLTGNRPSATVVAATECHFLAWEFSVLKNLCGESDRLKAILDAKISNDLVEKLSV